MTDGSAGNHPQGSQSDGVGIGQGQLCRGAGWLRLGGRPELLWSQKEILDIAAELGDLGGTQEAR
jgi:hypothetical protein